MQHFNDHVLQGLHQYCPKRCNEPKKKFIDTATWELRRNKLKLKKRLQALRLRCRDEAKLVCFQAWRSSTTSSSSTWSPDAELAWNYGNSMLCHSLRLTAQLHQVAHSLKGSLKDAKRKEIKEVFEDLDPKASASQILHTIRPIVGPTNLKKLKTNTLPYLRRPDGEICTLLTEALEVWISFFKDMEGVERITAAQQRKLWCSSLADLQQTSLGLNAQDLP